MTRELDALEMRFRKLINRFPSVKKNLVKSCGVKMYEKVNENIDKTVKAEKEELKRAVTLIFDFDGEKCVVRPQGKLGGHSKLIENGYKITSEKKGGFVQGKYMYRNALLELEDELVVDAENAIKKWVGDCFD